jgi:glycosyltransferase involved in cell wall biosynthesis
MRKPTSGQHSIELLFRTIREHVERDVVCTVMQCPFVSRGLLRIAGNAIFALVRQRQVNHITGDVHYLALLLSSSRTILTIHDANSVGRMRGWRRWIFLRVWFRWPAARARIVTTISNESRRQLIEDVGLRQQKIVVVPNCISPAFRLDRKPFPTTIPVVLHVGTKTNKNLIRLAEALRGIACRLEIVGRLTPGQFEALNGNDIDYGYSFDLSEEQLIDTYRRADLFAFVSTAEGFGLPILEAQAIGRPVVSSDISPMREIAGQGACLVDPFSIESIRGGIQKVMSDAVYREQLVQAGSQNVERYRAAEVARSYAALYRAIATKRNGVHESRGSA